jgi:hypothetical protein
VKEKCIANEVYQQPTTPDALMVTQFDSKSLSYD